MIALLLSLVLAHQGPAQRARVAWVPNPRTANGTWVSDAAGHLSAATRDSINGIIAALERETSAEIAVVIVDSLSGMAEQEFALAIHRAWGVGKADKDNGVVLLWAPPERATWVSVGHGLEGAITDRRSGRILDQHLIPAFREQRWADGMIATVAALAAAAREETSPRMGIAADGQSDRRADGQTDRRTDAQQPDDGGGGIPGPLLGVLGGLGALGAGAGSLVGWKRWKRRRPRQCPKCGTMMSLLDERTDDDKLDQGSKAEERIGSVDWDVWECPSCSETLHLPYRKIFSRFEDCPECKRHTVEVGGRTTITPATTLSTGTAMVSRKCKNCGHAWNTTETIPRIQSSSSSGGGSSFSGGSGGGGGSSFGGGSAGGGGAGRRY